MGPTTTPAEPASSAPRNDAELFRSRADRLRASALRAGLYAAAPMFVIAFAIVLIANRTPDRSAAAHVFDSLVRGVLGALWSGAAVAGGLWYASFVRGLRLGSLSPNGRPIPARLAGPPQVFGASFSRHVLGGVLGHLWEPVAPLLSRALPVFEVAYSYEAGGKTYTRSELFYGDEEVATSEDGRAWVLVDRDRPGRAHYLARTRGTLQSPPSKAA